MVDLGLLPHGRMLHDQRKMRELRFLVDSSMTMLPFEKALLGKGRERQRVSPRVRKEAKERKRCRSSGQR